MSKFWLLAARQAIIPTLAVAFIFAGFFYLRVVSVDPLRGAVVLFGTYLAFVAVERLALQRQHRGG